MPQRAGLSDGLWDRDEMIGIRNRTIAGLYVGVGRLQVAAVERKGLFGWKPVSVESAWGLEAGGLEPGLVGLRDLLQRVRPSRAIHWYLALPREVFFCRTLGFPAMPLEDAFDAVRAMLPTLVHLPLETIFFDVQLIRCADRSLRALLVYAEKKRIDPIRDVFRETGHEAGLKAVFPWTLGVASWLWLQKWAFPAALEIEYTGGREVAIFDARGCRLTVFGDPSDAQDLRAMLLAQGIDPADRIAMPLRGRKAHGESVPFGGTSGGDPDIWENRAAGALACALAPFQVVSVDGTGGRLKLFPFWKAVGTAVGVLVLGCSLWTATAYRTIAVNREVITALKEERVRLEQRVAPLETNRQHAEKARRLVAEIDEFMSTRPDVYRLINDFAERVPEGTWFSRFTFGEKDISIQGQSRDAIKVLEALRTSGMIDQIKLAGSVTKASGGLEQFTMNMKRKDGTNGEHGTGGQPNQ